jgi:hypothetical protein
MSFILDAIKGFGEWIWNGLVAIGNAIWNALVTFFQVVFVNPIVGIFNFIMNKIREKLKGIIFIVITIPSMIREIRVLMKSPSIKGILKFIAKPIVGYVVSEITYAVISPFLFPTYVTPPQIPYVTPFPQAPAPPPALVDYIRINDYISMELTDTYKLSDYVRIEDAIKLELVTTTSISDGISISDLLSIMFE